MLPTEQVSFFNAFACGTNKLINLALVEIYPKNSVKSRLHNGPSTKKPVKCTSNQFTGFHFEIVWFLQGLPMIF